MPLHANVAQTKDPPFLCLCDLQCSDNTRAASGPGGKLKSSEGDMSATSQLHHFMLKLQPNFRARR